MADPYDIHYAPEAADDVRGLRAHDRVRILDAIERHLAHEPTRVSKSRIKRPLQPALSQYRLRVDEFRVYYDVDEVVRVVAVLRVLENGTGTTPTEGPP